MKTIAVLGLGKFGFYIARSLSKLEDINVIAVDNDVEKVQEISENIENAFVLDTTNVRALEEAGITNLDTVIVSIGENIEASILTVMALKDLGNKNIIAKAITPIHGEVLAKIGAFKVVYPEKVAGKRLVRDLIGNLTVDMIDFSNSFKIIKFLATKSIIGKSIKDIEDIHPEIDIIAYKTKSVWNCKVDKSIIIKENDMLGFIGDIKSIEKFYNFL